MAGRISGGGESCRGLEDWVKSSGLCSRPGRILAEALWLQEQHTLLWRGWWPSRVSARQVGTLGAPQAKVERVERSHMTAACFQSKLAWWERGEPSLHSFENTGL